MHDDWNELGRQWRTDAGDASDAPLPDLPQRVQRLVRKRRRELAWEVAGTSLALALAGYGALRGINHPGGGLWLAGAAAFLLGWQILHLVLRHAFGLFITPAASLAAWLDAEQRRLRYAVASLWLGLVGGVLVLAWAQATMGFLDAPVVAKVVAAVAVGYAGWVVYRSWSLRRLLARVARERAVLSD